MCIRHKEGGREYSDLTLINYFLYLNPIIMIELKVHYLRPNLARLSSTRLGTKYLAISHRNVS